MAKRTWDYELGKQLYADGLSMAEIAERVGASANTISKAFQQFPKAERDALEEKHRQSKSFVAPEAELSGADERKPKAIDKGDYYIVTSSTTSVSITKNNLRRLKELYCLEGMTINEVCREMDIIRNEFFVIKTAFGITKDDVPALDEDLDNPEEVAERSLQQKKKLYFQHLEQKEIKVMEADLKKYRTKEFWLDKTLEALKEIKPIPREIHNPFLSYASDTVREAQLNLADWHTGMSVDNHWNTFNLAVLRRRVEDLLVAVVEDCKLYHVNTIHVMNLGDLIHGLIHTSTRVEAEFNVKDQVEAVVELLVYLLKELSNCFVTVKFYNTYGNHSRFTSNRRDALDSENFELLIPMALKGYLAEHDNVKFVENIVDDQWIIADICGHLVIGTHGDRDKIRKAPANITMMYDKPYKIFIGHQHHVESWTQHSVEIKMVGCMCGVETHAKDLRLTSKPSQNLCIYDKGGLIHSHDIELR